uniref:Uncharacterized protein n=1 Tax=Knipowitschia caucasica TaxID=637954 RepID=A0AAV2MLI1_KNICA
MVKEFQERWPALFEISEINSEFKRITTVPLQCKFLYRLDLYSAKLSELFLKRGGQLGQKLKSLMAPVTDSVSVHVRRECILKGLCAYMGEDHEQLVREYMTYTPHSDLIQTYTPHSDLIQSYTPHSDLI